MRRDLYPATGLPVNTSPARGISSPRLISAQTIAKGHWQPHQRAREAAAWISGRAHVKPTTVLASKVFGVSVPLIRNALRRENGNGTLAPTNLTLLGRAWNRATPAERAEFGRAIGVNVVWDEAVAPNLA